MHHLKGQAARSLTSRWLQSRALSDNSRGESSWLASAVCWQSLACQFSALVAWTSPLCTASFCTCLFLCPNFSFWGLGSRQPNATCSRTQSFSNRKRCSSIYLLALYALNTQQSSMSLSLPEVLSGSVVVIISLCFLI